MKTALNKNYMPICFVEDKLLAYQKEELFLIDSLDFSVSSICKIKIKDNRRPVCFFHLGERLAHITVYCGLQVDHGAIIAFNRGIYYVDLNTNSIIREYDFELKDMRRPLNFYQISGIKGFNNMILCPEYSGNSKRLPMSILSRKKDCTWEKVFTFPAGMIRHYHAVIGDPYEDRLIILTGDDGDECAIWETRNNFKEVNKIIGSSQKYRACFAKAYPEGILLATDSPYNQNYIYLLERGTNRINVIKEIAGPVVSYAEVGDDLLLSTTVECSQNHFFSQLTYKRGEGIWDKYVRLYKGNLYHGFDEVMKLPKDAWPMPAFGFGCALFPNGKAPGKMVFYPSAIKGDGHLKIMDV